MGASARDHGLPTQIHGDLPSALFGACRMAAQKGDDKSSLWIQHQNGGILLFALDPSGDEACHSPYGANNQHDVLRCPVLIKSGFDVLIDRLDLVDVAAQQKALQERQGAGRES